MEIFALLVVSYVKGRFKFKATPYTFIYHLPIVFVFQKRLLFINTFHCFNNFYLDKVFNGKPSIKINGQRSSKSVTISKNLNDLKKNNYLSCGGFSLSCSCSIL